MLILADLHLGKVTHFRKNGIPLPKQVEKDNYDRFSYLILNYHPEVILILGDLFHSHYNDEWEAFLNFISLFPKKEFILVKGNHDILDKKKYLGPNLTVYNEDFQSGPFHFTHHPEKHEHLYNICGHIHPSVRLRGKGLQRLNLPCFYFSIESAVLPAFGSFTGTYRVEPKKTDEIYAITEKQVIQVY